MKKTLMIVAFLTFTFIALNNSERFNAFADNDTFACDYTQLQSLFQGEKTQLEKSSQLKSLLSQGWKIIDFERNGQKWEYLLERCN